MTTALRTGWWSRVFAAMLARFGGAADRQLAGRKRELLGDLRGRVLEIGPGAGVNLAYYQSDVEWIGLEPNPAMDRYLRQAAARAGRPIAIWRGVAERIPADDGSLDAVVATHVLCSVDDLAGALAEVRRVLRPGGRFVFVEHVAARPGSAERRAQRLVAPLWHACADGCHPDRETGAAIDRAGFARVDSASFRLRAPIVAPHIAGVALR